MMGILSKIKSIIIGFYIYRVYLILLAITLFLVIFNIIGNV